MVDVGLFGALGLWRLIELRRARRDARSSATASSTMATWAAENGFEALDPLDPEVHERATEALMLAAADHHRAVGSVLRRRQPGGQLWLIDSWDTDGQSDRSLTCFMITNAVLRTDATSWDDGLQRYAFLKEGLPPRSNVQLAPGRITIHVREPLAPRIAADVVARACRFEATLARVPGSARL